MKLIRALQKGWCQHVYRDVVFGKLTSLRGDIGSGKTNFINGVVFAFTGDSRNEGNNDANISQLIGVDDPAFVAVEFEHNGLQGLIRRSLRPRGQELLLDGKKYTKDREIAEELRKLLGVDPVFLAERIFVPQWGIFSFIDQKAADRARDFGKLFGVGHAESLWEALGELKTPLLPIADDVTRLLAEEQKAAAAVPVWTAKLVEHDQLVARLRCDSEKRRQALASARAAGVLFHDLADTEKRYIAARGAVEPLRQRLATLAQEQAQAQQRAASLATACKDAAIAGPLWFAYRNAVRLRETAERTLQELEAQRQQIGEFTATVPAGYWNEAEREQWLGYRNRQEAETLKLRSFLNSCDPGRGIANCPTCGTPTDTPDLAGRIREAQTKLAQLDVQLVEVGNRRLWSTNYDRSRDDFQRRVQEAERNITGQRQLISCLPAATMPEVLETTVPLPVLQRDELQAGYQAAALTTQFNKGQAELANVSGQCEALLAQLRSLQQKVFELSPLSEDELKRLQDEDRQLIAAEGLLSTLQNELQQAKLTHEACARTRQAGEEAARRTLAITGLHDRVCTLRHALHRERLPSQVVRYNLTQLIHATNAYLVDFDDDLRIVRFENDHYVFRFRDGREQPATRLSGGQRMALGLAMRLAVNSMKAADLGLLCLDEPTVGLPAEKLAGLRRALDRFRKSNSGRELQVILMTHDAGLDEVCDTVIQFGGASP